MSVPKLEGARAMPVTMIVLDIPVSSLDPRSMLYVRLAIWPCATRVSMIVGGSSCKLAPRPKIPATRSELAAATPNKACLANKEPIRISSLTYVPNTSPVSYVTLSVRSCTLAVFELDRS